MANRQRMQGRWSAVAISVVAALGIATAAGCKPSTEQKPGPRGPADAAPEGPDGEAGTDDAGTTDSNEPAKVVLSYTAETDGPLTTGQKNEIRITVANFTDDFVNVSSLEFLVHIGPDGGDLTNDSGIDPTAGSATKWAIVPSSTSGKFIAKPKSPNKGLAKGETTTFKLSGFVVNEVPGQTSLDLTEKTDKQTASWSKPFEKVAPKFRITDMKAVPSIVAPGDDVVVSWTSEGAEEWGELRIAGLATADDDLPRADVHKVKSNGSWTQKDVQTAMRFQLTVFGDGGSDTRTVDVVTDEPKMVSFEPSAFRIPKDEPVELTWKAVNADKVRITPEGEGGPIDKITVRPTETQEWSAKAYMGDVPGSSIQKSIQVMDVAIACFANRRAATSSGAPNTLYWKVDWASSATLEPGVGEVDREEGTKDVSVDARTTFSLQAAGQNPQQADATLQPPPTWFMWSDDLLPATVHDGVAFGLGDTLFVATGVVGTEMNTQVHFSADGENWDSKPADGAITRQGAAAVVLGKTAYLMGGKTADGTALNDVWSSTDGVRWTRVTSDAKWPARTLFAAWATADKLFVAGGLSAGGSSLADVWSSPDGKTWTQLTAAAAFGARTGPGGAFYDGAMWVLGGRTGNVPIADVWKSTDGATWEEQPKPAWPARQQPFVWALPTTLAMGGGADGDGKAIEPDMWLLQPDGTWEDLKNKEDPEEQADATTVKTLLGVAEEEDDERPLKLLVPGANVTYFRDNIWIAGSIDNPKVAFFVPDGAK